jgi:hypothetical protein
MASKSLCLASAGPPARRRETNHSSSPSHHGKGNNRNGNSNRTKSQQYNKRQPHGVPMPSGGRKLSESTLGGELDFSLDYELDNNPSGRNNNRGRGRSANHLVNFTQQQQQAQKSGNQKRTRTRSSRYHGSHGKEDHVQATGQFVVLNDAKLETLPFMQNPNLAVPWKYIEAIRFHTTEVTNCPICLSPPIAAKAGRCGHAHCYSCVLHLLSIAESDKGAGCPICHCGIKMDELRSIIGCTETMPKPGSKLDFVKMTCAKDSVNPSVVAQLANDDDDDDWLDRYQRLIPVNRATLIANVIEREQAELTVQRDECEDSEIPFIEQAQAELAKRRESLESDHSLATTVAPFVSDESEGHYFYQCANGSPIFISSLNAKCLMSQYGSIKSAPDQLSGTVLEIDEFTMDAELRRRFRYLAHLSDGQPFFVVHLDARDLGLAEETFIKFKDQITARSRRKHQKDKEESKAHAKYEEYYDRELYGKYTPADIELADMEAFPSFDDTPDSPPNEQPVLVPEATWAGRKQPVQFNADDFFPSLGEAPATETAGSSGSFWGQMKTTTTPAKKYTSAPPTFDIDDEAAYARPNNNNHIGDEIANALKQQQQQAKSTDQQQQRGKKGQKKKKGTKIAF